MTRFRVFIVFIFAFANILSGQDTTAALDIQSSHQGVLFPRLSDSLRNLIVNPTEGLLIFNLSTHAFQYFDGIRWVQLQGDLLSEYDCGDGIDNDGNGFTDCQDYACACDTTCFECDCTDGLDNDNNGFTDCDDLNCLNYVECDCSDGIDNDGNGFTDCEDLHCQSMTTVECDCADGTDNDGDGLTDCMDPDCANAPDCP